MIPQVYIGYDGREPVAAHVARHSININSSGDVDVHYLKHRDLRKRGLFNREWIVTDQFRDARDGKPFSTEFSFTRFLVPFLQDSGWALFMDCDMVFTSDIYKLFSLVDDSKAVMCVKHFHSPDSKVKMDDREQTRYFRKNWSSFILINCSHPANKRLTIDDVNTKDGSWLHRFAWLEDDEIGSLPFSYNYIPGVSPLCEKPDHIHWTDGGPWFAEYVDCPMADVWMTYFEDWCKYEGVRGGNANIPLPSLSMFQEKEITRQHKKSNKQGDFL